MDVTLKIVGSIDLPTRAEVLSRLEALAQGTSSPEATASWAVQFVTADERGLRQNITDWAVWEALKLVAGADIRRTSSERLYGPEDFQQWAAELSAAPSGRGG